MIDRKGNVCDLIPEHNVKAVFCESLNNPSIVKCLHCGSYLFSTNVYLILYTPSMILDPF